MTKVLGVIPARLNSTRLPRKMLIDINGKPLLYYTYRQAQKAKTLDALVIATDSEEIRTVARAFGAQVVITPATIKSGSDRVAAAVKKFKDFSPDIVVNIQGDEPLMPPSAIDKTVQALINSPRDVVMATPAAPFQKTYDIKQPGFVKVVCDKDGKALYFSRAVIPYPRESYTKYLKHIGLYAYRADFLKKYAKLSQTPLEKTEKLEQLRVLEHGYTIRLVAGKFNTVEVNTPEELRRVRELI